MRADRLVATVLMLQQHGRVTAAALAAELGTSVATARRDLAALAAAGVPVYPQPGRGGGWQLVGGARTDLTGLNAGEAEAIFLVLGSAWPDVDPSTVRKLLRALPATFRDDAELASRAVHVDPAPWGSVPPPAQERLRDLQRAVIGRTALRLDYRRRTGEQAELEVEPLGLVDKGGRWYLVAGTDGGRRTLRVDRIRHLEPIARRFERPTDLDLAAEWQHTAELVEQHRSAVRATVRTETRFLPILRDIFGPALTVLSDQHGVLTASVGAHLAVSVAEQLAGWGDRVEVLDPPEVRAELARIGAELVARYPRSEPARARRSDGGRAG